MTTYQWTPLTEEERWRNAGLSDLLDSAALGHPLALLVCRRLQAAQSAMEPHIRRAQEDMERQFFERGTATEGLSSLLGAEVKT